MRNLTTERSDGIPPLGWMLEAREGRRAHAIIGRWVHLAEWGFSDGVWMGDLARPPGGVRFGASVVEESTRDGTRLVVLPASHTIEQVFVGRAKGSLLVSNYLPLLAAAEPRLLPWRADWGVRLAELSRGTSDYSRILHGAAGARLERYAYHPFAIEDDLSIREMPAGVASAPFATFEEYREWLLRVLVGVSQNAVDSRRSQTFPAMATCSSGYDSAAVAVLAREIGCREALGIAVARDGSDDSGDAIAAAVGINLQYVDRHACLDELAAVLPYLASGMSASDYALHDVFRAAEGRLLLTGVHGDVIWRLGAESSRELRRGELSGAGIQAARITLGFQHLPVPLIGACWHPEVLAISASEEMQRYRIGGTYDRPVPRRIVEQAGVPRQSFGQRKAAANIVCRSAWNALGDPALRTAVEARIARLSPVQRAHFWTWGSWPARGLRRALGRRRSFAEQERTGPLASVEFLTAVELLGRQLRPVVNLSRAPQTVRRTAPEFLRGCSPSAREPLT